MDVLQAYDEQIRTRVLPPRTFEQVGPLLRVTRLSGSGFITYRDLAGMDGDALDALIAAECDHFAAIGEEVEWKLHGHDLPEDLGDRLKAAGFVAEERETVMIGEVAKLAGDVVLPAGVALREAVSLEDWARVQAFEESIWGLGLGAVFRGLWEEKVAGGDPVVMLMVEAGGEVVCASWMRLHQGTDFVSLWGGSTLPAWRGRGIYRATVVDRANRAGGYRYLQVDASDESRPILARLGFESVTTTTPYVFRP
ncbi:GNAT family N-acetyltransferase [Nonomuraea sp. NPDC050556]|uniref:GNAT family N-acetyltransferase n=1 Tax=Nonomuraea sp. NPDC050556 TaxID=3364369 RepID=UPI0037ACEDB0